MYCVDVDCVCLQVNANGNVLRSEIVGAVKMRVYLSGTPELRLGLNDKVLFESTGSEYRLEASYDQNSIIHYIVCQFFFD
jgi:AP-1 complex subunit mu